MTVFRRISSGFFLTSAIALLALAGACSISFADNDNADNDTDDFAARSNGPSVDETAPDPVTVDADELDIIDEWQEAGVPRFRDGQVLDFEPHASRIENGGTLLLDGVNADATEILSFYRGALTALGWDERRVGEREMTAESDVASLLVTVTEYDDQTLIMMILTDSMRSDS